MAIITLLNNDDNPCHPRALRSFKALSAFIVSGASVHSEEAEAQRCRDWPGAVCLGRDRSRAGSQGSDSTFGSCQDTQRPFPLA